MLSERLWRFVRVGAAGLLLVAVAAGLVLGDAWLWVAVLWSPPIRWPSATTGEPGFSGLLTGLLVVAGLMKAGMVWLVLRAPRRGVLDRREAWLRGLLYLAVAVSLVLWLPLALLPDWARAALHLVLWSGIYGLYLLVIRWRSRGLRVAAGAVFAVETLVQVNDLLDELDLPEVGPWQVMEPVATFSGAVGTVVVLVGLRRDGRWSRGTLIAGWAFAGMQLLVVPLSWLLEPSIYAAFPERSLAMHLILHTTWLVGTGWTAAIAREMPAERGEAGVAPRWGRLARVGLAAVIVLPVVGSIQPERVSRHTYLGSGDDCGYYANFGDVPPEEREHVFLCKARDTMGGVPPMFPFDLSDQEVLAYGRALCHVRDREEQQAILERAGSERASWGADDRDLVYACPEVIGARRPELLRSSRETQASYEDYIRKENAKCRDPWPRTKGVVQASSKYFLFADGDHGYAVYDGDEQTREVEIEQAIDALYDNDLVGVAGGTVLVGHLGDVSDLCLTVKGLRTAPPPRTGGWDQVVEVPILSRTGRLGIDDIVDGAEVGAGVRIPNLAVAGKGRYRLRVYHRIDAAGEEHHLVVVFPGKAQKRVVLKALKRRP
ncbi:hypothetical protein [Nonomuraea sp. NPDC050310]|uniref:hypothetical protein n=1 Tax=Nonomuraea sp. NPDC050310 TaxID=3154935 RepID=UPI003401588D